MKNANIFFTLFISCLLLSNLYAASEGTDGEAIAREEEISSQAREHIRSLKMSEMNLEGSLGGKPRGNVLAGITYANAIYHPKGNITDPAELALEFVKALRDQMTSAKLITGEAFDTQMLRPDQSPRVEIIENKTLDSRMAIFRDPLNPERLAISIRGTACGKNWATNIAMIDPKGRTRGTHYGFQVTVDDFLLHKSFTDFPGTVERLLDIPVTDPEFSIGFYGHSKGAAEAQLLAHDFFERIWGSELKKGWGINPKDKLLVVAVSSPKTHIALDHPRFRVRGTSRTGIAAEGASPRGEEDTPSDAESDDDHAILRGRTPGARTSSCADDVARNTVIVNHDRDAVIYVPFSDYPTKTSTDISEILSSFLKSKGAKPLGRYHPNVNVVLLPSPAQHGSIGEQLASDIATLITNRFSATGSMPSTLRNHNGTEVLKSALTNLDSTIKMLSGEQMNQDSAEVQEGAIKQLGGIGIATTIANGMVALAGGGLLGGFAWLRGLKPVDRLLGPDLANYIANPQKAAETIAKQTGLSLKDARRDQRTRHTQLALRQREQVRLKWEQDGRSLALAEDPRTNPSTDPRAPLHSRIAARVFREEEALRQANARVYPRFALPIDHPEDDPEEKLCYRRPPLAGVLSSLYCTHRVTVTPIEDVDAAHEHPIVGRSSTATSIVPWGGANRVPNHFRNVPTQSPPRLALANAPADAGTATAQASWLKPWTWNLCR